MQFHISPYQSMTNIAQGIRLGPHKDREKPCPGRELNPQPSHSISVVPPIELQSETWKLRILARGKWLLEVVCTKLSAQCPNPVIGMEGQSDIWTIPHWTTSPSVTARKWSLNTFFQATSYLNLRYNCRNESNITRVSPCSESQESAFRNFRVLPH